MPTDKLNVPIRSNSIAVSRIKFTNPIEIEHQIGGTPLDRRSMILSIDNWA
ncbi:hypothetical protein [Chamaesiphon sp.]|uniref:hypothetical protein n=1 Tax=Chamaesiphon sp. TaxID=2814140 RepID=UPI00359439F3